MKKIKVFLLSLLSVFALSPIFMFNQTYAVGFQDDINKSIKTEEDEPEVNNMAKKIINIIIYIVAIMSVIMIIVGGLKYVLSSGESSKISNAKQIIIYSVIGLIVSIMAGAIVKFVIKTI